MENIKITSFDDAITHLSEVIANVASTFSQQDQGDISQACWLKVFTLIKEKGEVDLAVLIKCIPRTARRESRALNNYGLTPYKSKHKPPTLHSAGVMALLSRPTTMQAEEEVLRDVEMESTGEQERIIRSFYYLLGEGRKPTQEAVAEMLGTPVMNIRRQIRNIRKKYHDNNKD
jgi:hypothetical protein